MLFKDNECAKVVGNSGALRHTTEDVRVLASFEDAVDALVKPVEIQYV